MQRRTCLSLPKLASLAPLQILQVLFYYPDAANFSNSSNPFEIEPLLEENPKWTALKEVMKEIQSEIDSRPEGELPSYKTLIVTDDDRTCLQLRQILQTSSRQFLLNLYQKSLASNQGNDRHK